MPDPRFNWPFFGWPAGEAPEKVAAVQKDLTQARDRLLDSIATTLETSRSPFYDVFERPGTWMGIDRGAVPPPPPPPTHAERVAACQDAGLVVCTCLSDLIQSPSCPVHKWMVKHADR